jgi:hypothetical protein
MRDPTEGSDLTMYHRQKKPVLAHGGNMKIEDLSLTGGGNTESFLTINSKNQVVSRSPNRGNMFSGSRKDVSEQ